VTVGPRRAGAFRRRKCGLTHDAEGCHGQAVAALGFVDHPTRRAKQTVRAVELLQRRRLASERAPLCVRLVCEWLISVEREGNLRLQRTRRRLLRLLRLQQGGGGEGELRHRGERHELSRAARPRGVVAVIALGCDLDQAHKGSCSLSLVALFGRGEGTCLRAIGCLLV
jgi:hypothetical protein